MDKEFCIIGFDNLTKLKDEIISIASDNPDFVISKKIIISRFKSKLDANNMYDVFDSGENRSFFVFELNPLTSAVHIDFEEYQGLLFKNFDKNKKMLNENEIRPGFAFGGVFGDNIFNMLNLFNGENGHDMSRFDISAVGVPNSVVKNNKDVKEEEYSEEILNGYSKTQKQELIDKLLVKGSDLTDEDKRILDFLVKN